MIITLLRVAALLFAAAGLVAALVILPRSRAARGRLEDTADASVLPKPSNFPHTALLVVNESILANGLGLTAGMGQALSLTLAAAAVALSLGGFVALLRTFYRRRRL